MCEVPFTCRMLNFTSLRRGHGFAELRQDSRCESMPNQKGVNAVFKIKAKTKSKSREGTWWRSRRQRGRKRSSVTHASQYKLWMVLNCLDEELGALAANVGLKKTKKNGNTRFNVYWLDSSVPSKNEYSRVTLYIHKYCNLTQNL